MKIDKYYFPVIVLSSFVIAMLLAMILGFMPEHADAERQERRRGPGWVQRVERWEALQ